MGSVGMETVEGTMEGLVGAMEEILEAMEGIMEASMEGSGVGVSTIVGMGGTVMLGVILAYLLASITMDSLLASLMDSLHNSTMDNLLGSLMDSLLNSTMDSLQGSQVVWAAYCKEGKLVQIV